MSSSIRPHRDQSIVQLVQKLAKDLQSLLRLEIALAKTELTDQLKLGAVGGGLVAVAGLLSLFALLFLSVGAALALALVVPTWAAFLIVGGVYLLITIVAILVGRSRFKKIKGLQRTATTVQQAQDLVTEHVRLEGDARDEGLSVSDLAARTAAEAAQAGARDAQRAAASAAAATGSATDSIRQNAEQWQTAVDRTDSPDAS